MKVTQSLKLGSIDVCLGASVAWSGDLYGPGGEGGFIDRVYEAAAVPELWRGVLLDFARIAEAKFSLMGVARGTSFQGWVLSSPEFEDVVLGHIQRFPGNMRTTRLLAAQHAGFLTDRDVLSHEEIDREPLYQELLIPKGYGVGVATAIHSPSGDLIIVHAEYARDQGPVRRDVFKRLDRLRPHLARAALLSTRLELARANATAAALELVGLPAAVLRRGGRLLAANALLVDMMPDVVRDRPSRLGLADAAADALLEAALASVEAAPHGFAILSIPISAKDDRPPVIVHLIPIRGAAHDMFARAATLVVATLVVPKAVPGAGVLQGLFDLTPAEAKLAALIAAGHPPAAAALRLGVTIGTARTTLKCVLAKTGVSRQADLVALLQGGSLP